MFLPKFKKKLSLTEENYKKHSHSAICLALIVMLFTTDVQMSLLNIIIFLFFFWFTINPLRKQCVIKHLTLEKHVLLDI